MKDYNQGLFEFIAESPTCFHAVAAAAQRLEQAGFTRLAEGADWRLEKDIM